MLRAIGLPLMCLAMFSIAGGHWAVLQTVAWTQMLRDYSKNATVAEAVTKTFSGKAPCSMCKSIAEQKQKEEKTPATLKVDKKAELFSLADRNPLPPRCPIAFSYRFPADVFFGARSFPPSDPVPILSV